MRNIKFRAFDRNNRRFVDLNREPEYIGDGYYFISPEDGGVVEVSNDSYDSYPDVCEAGYEVTEYTGINDRNGREIYEGDLIKKSDGKIEAVIFSNGVFCLKNYKHPLWRVANDCEVVGNVFLNSDLLN